MAFPKVWDAKLSYETQTPRGPSRSSAVPLRLWDWRWGAEVTEGLSLAPLLLKSAEVAGKAPCLSVTTPGLGPGPFKNSFDKFLCLGLPHGGGSKEKPGSVENLSSHAIEDFTSAACNPWFCNRICQGPSA